jgi:hypothetical protein
VPEREPGRLPLEPGGDDFRETGLPRPGHGERDQRVGDLGGLLGRHVETQRLDRHEQTIGFGLGAVDRAQNTNTNLMQDPEGTEGAWREKGIREIVVQRRTPRPPDP